MAEVEVKEETVAEVGSAAGGCNPREGPVGSEEVALAAMAPEAEVAMAAALEEAARSAVKVETAAVASSHRVAQAALGGAEKNWEEKAEAGCSHQEAPEGLGVEAQAAVAAEAEEAREEVLAAEAPAEGAGAMVEAEKVAGLEAHTPEPESFQNSLPCYRGYIADEQ